MQISSSLLLVSIFQDVVGEEKSLNLKESVQEVDWIEIAVAALAFILSFMGCCSVLCKNSCTHSSFSILLAIFLSLQLAIFAVVYYMQDIDS
jgi:Tetraspanin family